MYLKTLATVLKKTVKSRNNLFFLDSFRYRLNPYKFYHNAKVCINYITKVFNYLYREIEKETFQDARETIPRS